MAGLYTDESRENSERIQATADETAAALSGYSDVALKELTSLARFVGRSFQFVNAVHSYKDYREEGFSVAGAIAGTTIDTSAGGVGAAEED